MMGNREGGWSINGMMFAGGRKKENWKQVRSKSTFSPGTGGKGKKKKTRRKKHVKAKVVGVMRNPARAFLTRVLLLQ